MEDFKLREYYPLKLFEILEEKIQSKELSLMSILSQTKYFKKLLEQTYNMRKGQSKLRDYDTSEQRIPMTIELVESKMHEVGHYLEKQIQ